MLYNETCLSYFLNLHWIRAIPENIYIIQIELLIISKSLNSNIFGLENSLNDKFFWVNFLLKYVVLILELWINNLMIVLAKFTFLRNRLNSNPEKRFTPSANLLFLRQFRRLS